MKLFSLRCVSRSIMVKDNVQCFREFDWNIARRLTVRQQTRFHETYLSKDSKEREKNEIWTILDGTKRYRRIDRVLRKSKISKF